MSKKEKEEGYGGEAWVGRGTLKVSGQYTIDKLPLSGYLG